MSIKILDCTLRDGGYYNNWQFSKKFIQNYIDHISRTEVDYIEIGFIFFPQDKKKGLTAFCDKNFLNKFSFPKNKKWGVMINASDLINLKNSEEKKITDLLTKLINSKISFIRIACHFDEVFKIKKYMAFLKKKKIKLIINIMQISEINGKSIKQICNFSNNYFDILYIADSLGSLKENKLKNIILSFKKYWKKDMGIHAHDNLFRALKNTIVANKLGVQWLDCTINGMGRGPGNTKTEELINYFSNKRKKNIKKLVKQFLILKKKYKWGTNHFYKLSGKYGIHPTYIQTMLSDRRYKRIDYVKAINFLKNNNTKKFDPFTLLSAFDLYNFKDYNFIQKIPPIKIDNYDKALILGPGKRVQNIKDSLYNSINKNKLLVICLNNTKTIKENYINIRAFCHPIRILSNLNYFKKCSKNILVPYSCLSKKTQNYFNKKNIIDYGIKINKDLNINKNYVSVSSPLALIYSISFLISRNIKTIYLAGFDGYSKDEPNQDIAPELMYHIKKRYYNEKLNIYSLTKTKLKLNKKNISQIQ